jgi:hypothetical protein
MASLCLSHPVLALTLCPLHIRYERLRGREREGIGRGKQARRRLAHSTQLLTLTSFLKCPRYRAPKAKKGKPTPQFPGEEKKQELGDVVWKESEEDVAWIPPSGQTGRMPPTQHSPSLQLTLSRLHVSWSHVSAQ